MNNKERLAVWRALSELFLDTEIDRSLQQSIAQTIKLSEYTLQQVEDILWAEVYPVLKQNLASTAGIWDGWSDSWLQENLQAYENPEFIRKKSIFYKTGVSNEIKQHWSEITKLVNSI